MFSRIAAIIVLAASAAFVAAAPTVDHAPVRDVSGSDAAPSAATDPLSGLLGGLTGGLGGVTAPVNGIIGGLEGTAGGLLGGLTGGKGLGGLGL